MGWSDDGTWGTGQCLGWLVWEDCHRDLPHTTTEDRYRQITSSSSFQWRQQWHLFHMVSRRQKSLAIYELTWFFLTVNEALSHSYSANTFGKHAGRKHLEKNTCLIGKKGIKILWDGCNEKQYHILLPLLSYCRGENMLLKRSCWFTIHFKKCLE